jgi:predicted HTH transcriptional regulator
MRALLMDLEEYHVLLPSKLEKKERKIRKEKLSSKRPESTPLKRGENPCTLAPSEVVKEERVEGKWHWENGTGRKSAEIRQGIILDLLRKHPEMTEPELTVGLKRSKRISASGIRVSLSTVKRDIAHLEKVGILSREGTDFDGRWRVTEE